MDAPGFKNIEKAIIQKEVQGYKRFHLPRKRPKFGRYNIIPSSATLCYGWRANCDVKILLYASNPELPLAKEIAEVTNYVVAYASKGIETVEAEKQQMKALIMTAEEVSGCQRDIVALARRLLNKHVGEKMMSKQECMVQLAGMDLWLCSESFERISLSGCTKIDKNGTKGSNKYLTLYSNRNEEVRTNICKIL
jgi:hypothetical protein